MGSDQAPEVVPESACWVIPVGNNWSFFKGVLHLWQTGCLWQDMHERYDKWNSVCLQFRRWSVQGIWDALLQALVDLGLTDGWQHIIDSTTVRSHVSAVSGKGGLCVGFWWITQRLYEQSPRPLRQSRTAYRVHPDRWRCSDYAVVDDLMTLPLPKPKALLADKGYDDDRFRENLLIRDILTIIPPRLSRKVPAHPDYQRYKDRNRVERMFGKLKQKRRITTRYGKTVLSFESFLNLAAAGLWLKSFVNVV